MGQNRGKSMQKIGYLIILIAIALIVYLKYPRKITKSIKQEIGNTVFSLEVADNLYLHGKGLSGRQELCSECGMIFVFPFESFQSFWMKDTLIPLDMIFIDKYGIITDIYTALPEPNKSDLELTFYQSTKAVKYVIELNYGQANKLNLKKGDNIKINLN